MVKKRLVGVITVRGGRAVQSVGYRRYLPLGTALCLAENLDRWGVDEILVIGIDRTALGPDIPLLAALGSHGLSTPITFGGGIRSVADAVKVVQTGADRVFMDRLLEDDPDEVERIAERLGGQAIVGVFPARIGPAGQFLRLRYWDGQEAEITPRTLRLFESSAVSEALVVDHQHEGMHRGYDLRLLDAFPLESVPLVSFGGLSDAEGLGAALANPRVVAAASGNFLSYREHAVPILKAQLRTQSIRSTDLILSKPGHRA